MISEFDKPFKRSRFVYIKEYSKLIGKESLGDIIPLWVADMDFKTPQVILDALQDLGAHGIFGYYVPNPSVLESIAKWILERQNWEISTKWIRLTPTVMYTVVSAIRALTKEGDPVLVFQPVYSHFADVIHENHRKMVVSELRLQNGRYEMDFEDLEKKIREENVKTILFCSPHNPGGRVWTKDELLKLAAIVEKFGIRVISDEIHADFVYSGHRHIPFCTLSEYTKENSIICFAPTKSFNLAAIQGAGCIIPNPALRTAVKNCGYQNGVYGPSIAGAVAMEAAYRSGGPWFNALLKYLDQNIQLVEKELSGTPLHVMHPEGTYLLWIDCRELPIPSGKSLQSFFIEKAHVWLSEGSEFGKGGEGFVRMNIATSRSTLQEALLRIKSAVHSSK
ncbi:MAG: pyridoxal phosphate-dependent aminotransferase [Fibrobacter sp.]|nr:pyridoxal phosphate-dependent aminotransferase [Fibrobacter sp.]